MVKSGSGVLVWAACLLLVFPATATEPQSTRPEVDTLLRLVQGRQVGVKGTDRLVNVFLGISFAQPPLGPLRFSAPLPDASTDPPMCMQDIEKMNNSRFSLNGKQKLFPISEDCLILNIYSPAKATTKARKPVMVWIHGGVLVIGSATSQDGSALAAYDDVVVVTIQYRLGILEPAQVHCPARPALTQTGVEKEKKKKGRKLVLRGQSQFGVTEVQRIRKVSHRWQLADSLGCSSHSPAELVQCFRQREAEELILTKNWYGSDLLDKMEQMNREHMLDTLKPPLTSMNVPPEMMSLVLDQYLSSASDAQARREAFQELVPIFFYEFQHVPSSFAKIKPHWVKADHAAERAFVFGGPFLMDKSTLLAFPEATEEEKQLSLTMMAQWAQDPNGEGLPLWPQFNQLEQYLEISLVPRIRQKLKEAQMQFWTETLPSKIQQWQQQKQGRKIPEEL
uniref:Carboxylesterase 3 n=1 Tax=Cavia porcellus TaxID=10141 RepID=A0A286XAF4_CAVPO